MQAPSYKATVTSSLGNQVKLQVELRPYGSPFNDAETAYLHESALVASGTLSTVQSPTLADDQYHWRARVVDDRGNASVWQEYGTTGNVDFAVSVVRTIRVAVILSDLADIVHNSSNVAFPSLAPCKLKPTEIYPDHFSKKYYEDIGSCVQDYYDENSSGKIRLSFDVVAGTIVDGAGVSHDAWYQLPGNEAYYASQTSPEPITRNALSIAPVIPSDYDVVVSLHAGTRKTTEEDSHIASSATITGNDELFITLAEDDGVGAWAHELGHAIGALQTPQKTVLPDLYKRGSVGPWDIMATGNMNGDGRDPAALGAFTRIFLGWRTEEQHALPDSVQKWVNALPNTGFGEPVLRYNLVPPFDSSSQKYYLVEARNPNVGRWDTAIPTDAPADLLLYYVDTHGRPMYDYERDIAGNRTLPDIMRWNVTIPSSSTGGYAGVLSPYSGASYADLNHLVRITASAVSGDQIRADIATLGPSWFPRTMIGSVLDTSQALLQRINFPAAVFRAMYRDPKSGSLSMVEFEQRFPQDYAAGARQALGALLAFCLSLLLLSWARFRVGTRKNPPKERVAELHKGLYVLQITAIILGIAYAAAWVTVMILDGQEKAAGIYRVQKTSVPFGTEYRAAFGDETAPDLDLHVYCPDGRHVGMNYATGQYENQITDSIASGDNRGAPEWIFFPPAGNEGCRHVVSAHDNAQFLAENPDIASQLTDTSDAYDVYARYIDPATGIFTSTTLANQTIQPGAEVVHEVTGTTDVAIGAGVVDTTAPTTSASLSGTFGADGATYVSPVTVTLSSDDGADGTGSSGIRYSPDGGLTWLDYSAPFTLSDDGAHTLFFGASDHAGNVEATKTTSFVIDTTPPDTILDSAPSDSTGSTSATFVFHATEANSTFECRLDSNVWTPYTSPATSVGLTVGGHAFDVRATDPAGNVDATPASASWTVLATGTINVTFDRHTVQTGTQPGSTKSPIIGATVNAYTKAAGSCAATVGSNPHDYGMILSTCTPDASGTTDANGVASITMLPGDYLVLSRDSQTNVVAGVSSGTIAAADTVDKFLQVIVRANGTSVPGKTTTRTGSLLYIIEPEYVEWSQAQELYPFVFDAPSGDWGITVTVTPPEGFTADYQSLSTDVNGDYKALQFTLTDVGSCWECGTGVDLTIRHKGRTEHLRHVIPTPMTEEFVKQKGLTVSELEDRGVRVRR